ncbi:MAG TPA: hypothetical protein VNT26_09125, partial [Candidatus Sulfotelmatobacter sp.]|nr:hypothetical protein [Candidatus Sulfotelmatobacter sp.]
IACLIGMVALLLCGGCATGKSPQPVANAGGASSDFGETTLYGHGSFDSTNYQDILSHPGPY